MKRLRLLAGLLGCLAILVAGLPVVALAQVPTADTAHPVGVEPCQHHCPDCSGSTCPTGGAHAAMGCMIGCLAVPLTLGAATFILPAVETGKTIWPPHLVALNGLSLSPDPFPPRS